MNLISIYTEPKAVQILWDLLLERPPEANISHKAMPTMDEHIAFIASVPYAEWNLIEVEGEYVGCTYLTRDKEIGVSIFRKYVGRRYGRQAVRAMMQRHPGRILANVSPLNYKSTAMFEALGFRLLQKTYSHD